MQNLNLTYAVRDGIISQCGEIDENNLKQLSSDLGIDYIYMNKQNNINSKLKNIAEQASKSETTKQKVNDYKDIYYYFAIPLMLLLIINFIIQKRRI